MNSPTMTKRCEKGLICFLMLITLTMIPNKVCVSHGIVSFTAQTPWIVSNQVHCWTAVILAHLGFGKESVVSWTPVIDIQ